MTDLTEQSPASFISTPPMTDAHRRRVLILAEPSEQNTGDYAVRAGDANYPMVLVESGTIELVRGALLGTVEPSLGCTVHVRLSGSSAYSMVSALCCRCGPANQDAVAYSPRRTYGTSRTRTTTVGQSFPHSVESPRSTSAGTGRHDPEDRGTSRTPQVSGLTPVRKRLDLIRTAYTVHPDDSYALDDHGFSVADLPTCRPAGSRYPGCTAAVSRYLLSLMTRIVEQAFWSGLECPSRSKSTP